MKIIISNPIHPIDEYASKAFIQILNMLLLADNIVELNAWLIDFNISPQYRSLSGYFSWSFGNQKFTLRQRIRYGSQSLFKGDILEVSFLNILYKNTDITININ
ncbi:MAG: hypothetical protein LBV74_02095 [Tannerella sp.]|jgi:hypothetical protein|nr:hypothetical protein [Tannerella sp.]